MITKISKDTLYLSNLGWLKSRYHFSFAEYSNPANIRFGVLRVLNDDVIEPHTGFEMHPHRDMEIFTYVINGELTHRDSIGHEGTLRRGHIQYMSAGTGIYHSEQNQGETPLHLLQIWVLPDQKGHSPAYGDHALEWDLRVNRFYPAVSYSNGGIVRMNQDVNIYISAFDTPLTFDMADDRMAYLVVMEGACVVDDRILSPGDALTSIGENMKLIPRERAHVLVIEMANDQKLSNGKLTV